MEDIVILDGARTPMAEYNGVFSDITAIDLAVHASREALRRAGTEPGEIEHVIFGNALQTSGDAIYGARHVSLKADIPKEVPALTVNRLCGSGFESIVQASHRILLGEARTVLAGGMENMSQAPHVIRGARKGLRLGQGELEDSLMVALLDSYSGLYMAQTSDRVAAKYGITREEQDAYALSSQRRAAPATTACRLSEEIVPVEVRAGRKKILVEKDDHPRPDTTLETLAALPPSFGAGGPRPRSRREGRSRAGRPEERRHLSLGDQRGLRGADPRGRSRARPRSRDLERQRRSHRARPPAGRHRHALHADAPQRAAAAQSPVRPGRILHRRGTGNRRRRRVPFVTAACPISSHSRLSILDSRLGGEP